MGYALALDQIKQHVESQITGISQEIKELKNLIVTSSRPDPPAAPNIVGLPLAESTPAPPRPTDKQFQNVVERSRIRSAIFNDGEQSLQLIAKEVGLENALSSSHPVLVASQCIDLAVVSKPSQGL